MWETAHTHDAFCPLTQAWHIYLFIYFIYLTTLLGTSTSSKWIHIQGKRQKMDRHTPKGSVRTGHGVPCGALPLIKTKTVP